MSKRPHWNHSPGFKAKVALAAVKGEKKLAELAQQFDVRRRRSAFTGEDRRSPAKIGELTLAIDLLAGAPGKAGLLQNARR